MKRTVTPSLLAVAVFLVSLLAQKYTLICQEYDGLFLLTPDYWQRAWGQSFPISGIVSDFLVQFFRFSLYAPFIVTALVVAEFFCLRRIFPRAWGDVPSALGACAYWVILALSSSPKTAIAILLISVALTILFAIFVKWKKVTPSPSVQYVIPSAIVCVTLIFICVNPHVRRTELYSKVKHFTLYTQWDKVIDTVSPRVAEKEGELTPFALLALSGSDILGEAMFRYPVHSEADLDMNSVDGRDDYYLSLFFKAALYDLLGCENESIHNLFQLSTQQEKGMSFMVLRKLVQEYCSLGNYTLMEKYCRILEKSTLHGQYVRHYRQLAASGGPQQEVDSVEVRSQIPVISHDPLYNLLKLESMGMHSKAGVERVLATFILRQDLPSFSSVMGMVLDSYDKVPRHFQEAMMLAGMDSDKITKEVREMFENFMMDAMMSSQEKMEQKYHGTAFLHFLFSERAEDAEVSSED